MADDNGVAPGICPNCHGPIEIRNPTGTCDHLYWPENLTPTARALVDLDEPRGLSASEGASPERVSPSSYSVRQGEK